MDKKFPAGDKILSDHLVQQNREHFGLRVHALTVFRQLVFRGLQLVRQVETGEHGGPRTVNAAALRGDRLHQFVDLSGELLNLRGIISQERVLLVKNGHADRFLLRFHTVETSSSGGLAPAVKYTDGSMNRISRRTPVAAAIGAPALLRGRFQLFAQARTGYSARTLQLMSDTPVVDLLNQFRFADYADKPPKSELWMRKPDSFTAADAALPGRSALLREMEWLSRLPQ